MNLLLAERKTLSPLVPVFILLGLALRVIFWTGPTGSDDANYFDFAAKFVSFQPFSELHHSVRLVFLAVIGAPAVLLDSMSVGIAVNVLLSLVNDLITVWIAYRLFGERAAVAAAFVMAFCGINIVYPSTFLPDTLLTTLFLVAFLLVERATATAAVSWRWMFAAGLATAAAYSVKETGILLVPPVLLFVFLRARQPGGRWIFPLALYGVGIAVGVLIENTIYFAYTDHFFYRQLALAKANETLLGEGSSLGKFIRETGEHLTRFATRHVAYGTVAMLAAIPLWVLMLRDRGVGRLVALIGGFTLAYLLVGTTSLTQLVALPYQPRYFQPVIPFAALALAEGYADAAAEWPAAKVVAYIVAALVAVPSVLAAPLVAGNQYNEAYYRNVAAIAPLLISSGKPVFMERGQLDTVRHFTSRETYSGLSASSTGSTAAGYYIVNPTRTDWRQLAQQLGAEHAFEVHTDTRTYRRYFPNIELPDLSPIDRRRVVVLQKPAKTEP